MQTFSFHALTASGELERGVITAADRRTAEFELAHLQLISLSRRLGWTSRRRTVPNTRHLTDLHILFTRLGVLVHAGIEIPHCLQMMQGSADGRQRELIEYLSQGIASGNSLSALTQARSAEFGGLIPALLSVAESTGTLPQCLDHIVAELAQQISTLQLIRQVSVYPMTVTVILFAAIVFLLVYIVPSLQVFIESSGQALPLHTRVLIGLSEQIARYWLVLLFGLALLVMLMQAVYRFSARCRQMLDYSLLVMPVIGPVMLSLSLGRICASLAVLQAGGVDIVESLTLCRGATGNRHMQHGIDNIQQQVEAGVALSNAVAQQSVIPPLVHQLINNGEAAGKLVNMLTYLGQYYQAESERRLNHCVSLTGPALMCVVGGVMLWVVVSVLGPVYETVFNAGVL